MCINTETCTYKDTERDKHNYDITKRDLFTHDETDICKPTHRYTHTHARTHSRTHARTHARTHTHTHTHEPELSIVSDLQAK